MCSAYATVSYHRPGDESRVGLVSHRSILSIGAILDFELDREWLANDEALDSGEAVPGVGANCAVLLDRVEQQLERVGCSSAVADGVDS